MKITIILRGTQILKGASVMWMGFDECSVNALPQQNGDLNGEVYTTC